MAIATYTCERCGDSLSIAGENHGSDEDYAAEQHFDETVEWHESGECAAVAAVEPEPVKPDPRAEYIAGLRALGDWLTDHAEVPLPYGAGTEDWTRAVMMTFYLHTKEQMVAFAKAFPGKLDKQVDDTSNSFGFELHGSLHGLHLYAAVDRDEVCERIVVGEREVTKTVAVKTEEVTVTEDIVEWRCSPLLAEDREPEAVAV